VPRYTLRQLEYFCAVAANGTLARAAEECRVSKSALAAAIDALEEEVGATLLNRRRAVGVELTPEGELFLDGALSLLRSAEDLERSPSSGALRGRVRVGTSVALAPVILPPVLDRLGREHPGLDVDATVRVGEELERMARAGDLEVVASYSRPVDRTMESRTLFTTRAHVMLEAGHPLAGKPSLEFEDIRDEPFILLDTPQSADDILRYLHAQQASPEVRFRTTSIELWRSLVACGMGISMGIDFPRADSYEGRPILRRPVFPRPAAVAACLLWPRGRRLSAKGRLFVEACTEEAAGFAPPDLYAKEA
jgi:DNA-binding transcriptional LysR family regulator